MEDLPREMLNEILSWLDKPSLFQASNVCKLWRRQALTHVITISSEDQLKIAAINGDRLGIIFSPYINRDWIKTGLYGACKGGHKDLVELMMTDDTLSLNWGLHGACEGGHNDLVRLMLTKGAYDYYWRLYYACLGGHEELAELMIAENAKSNNAGLYPDHKSKLIYDQKLLINRGFGGACKGGHKNIMNLMKAKGARECSCVKSIEDH